LAKEWPKSDELRDKLSSLGWDVRDAKDGQTLTKRGGASG
jgi:cysteinyl-tRNA synthetase